MTMRRKKAAAIFPKPWPDRFAIGLRQLQIFQFRAFKKIKTSFPMHRWQRFKPWLHFEQEHQPVTLSKITVFADRGREVKIAGVEADAEFLTGFPASAGIRRFTNVRMEFAPARTPKPAIRFLRAFQEQHAIPLVKAIKQRGDAVR